MELVIANNAGATVDRYRVICCSQELGDVVELVVYPDHMVIPTRKQWKSHTHPINASLLVSHVNTGEVKRIVVEHSKVIH
ncbi:hypothetical protein MLDJOKPK_00261 [Salmonella phage SPAsTU]|nr:hypothetical protein MLDJOKPK_00261 [Salmonella phage SPAsTU]